MTEGAPSLSVRCYGAAHGSHAHPHAQILIGLDGWLDLEVAGRGQRIAPGQACLVAAGERHDFEARQGARCLVLDTQDPAWAGVCTEPARPAALQALAQYLAAATDAPLAQLWGPSLLREVWAPVATSTTQRRRIDWLALGHWAQGQWQAPLQVADLAAQVHLSPSQLAARAREELGLSALQWLRQLRLLQAQKLRQQGLSVAETARRTGYRSPSALTAALKRERFNQR
ncbi:helix-turn-helix domain-containing protein [Hydrogenophaga sp.]|uniref:helix-turn-helix domain-containing protein n=1 Tax=Hydrogenophaga sp. TaxID=1904254 RepID=UPI003561E821